MTREWYPPAIMNPPERSSPSVALTPAARDGWADAVADADDLRDATPQRRYALLASACEAVFEILADHPLREEILAYEDPLPPETRPLLEHARQATRG